MRLLLDTHVFLWAASEPERIDSNARREVENADNELVVSAAVAWELAIKTALGKLSLPGHVEVWFASRARLLGCRILDITATHALATASLPALHRDPFDRIIIAQAQVEGMMLVTRDRAFAAYPVNVLLA